MYCGIAGEHVAGQTSTGVVSVTGGEIRTGDVARVNDVACNVPLGQDHELLHAIPQDYLVDLQPGISEPIGMTGSRLDAEVYLVTVLSSVPQNLRKCVEGAGYHVGEFVLEPLAASPRGADAGRAGAGVRPGRAGRRVHQRRYLPGRQDPAHRVAADVPAATSPTTSCTGSR